MFPRSIKIFIGLLFFAPSVLAQSAAEKEVLKVNSDFDKAALTRDLALYERILAPNFVSYDVDGALKTRAEQVERFKKEQASPTFKFNELESKDVKAKVSGNLAVVTGKWKVTTTSTKDTDPVPHTDEGFYTSVYEKIKGRWMLIIDHATEKPHTAAELEPSLRKASDDYDKALSSKNAGMFERLLADDYTSVNETGQLKTKKDDIINMTSPDLVFTSNKVDDKKFRIHRSSAVETGRYTSVGSYKGKPFSVIGRYTSTWFYKDGKWKMVADHTSHMPQTTTTPASGN